ncbi:hypothetical protein SCLCIDRAFT_285896 [Scleroderma citrinum Foug A]|uniref:Uncharacterized protein n=1 Tax=Scleroderma citrinum Foug A TaxID=1036808 RepID=A0A0C2ZT56_9AGAM|nr:hypothetical protein SCLCIDRAFT_285896 [Scleroderma citrinum Foug A]
MSDWSSGALVAEGPIQHPVPRVRLGDMRPSYLACNTTCSRGVFVAMLESYSAEHAGSFPSNSPTSAPPCCPFLRLAHRLNSCPEGFTALILTWPCCARLCTALLSRSQHLQANIRAAVVSDGSLSPHDHNGLQRDQYIVRCRRCRPHRLCTLHIHQVDAGACRCQWVAPELTAKSEFGGAL